MTWLFVILAVSIFIASVLLVMIHLGFRAPRRVEQITPADLGFEFSQAWIPTVRQRRLFSWLLPAERQSDEWIVMLHGWGGNAEMMLPLVRPFHSAGWGVLLFDARNHGSSDGDGMSSMPRFAEDLDHVIDWLQERAKDVAKLRIALLGHSVGAGAVLLAAARRGDIAAVISISAFAHPKWMMRRYLDRRWIPKCFVGLINAYVQWVIGHRFADIAPVSTACEVTAPVLLVHGTEDKIVPVADAHQIYEQCCERGVKLFEVPDAGHTSIDRIEENAQLLVDFLLHAGFSRSTTTALLAERLPPYTAAAELGDSSNVPNRAAGS